MLRRMLSDQRLSTSHKTLNMCMSIKMNDVLWSKQERGMVMERALEIFVAKELQTLDQTAPTGEPSSKKARLVSDDDEIEDFNDSEYSDEEKCEAEEAEQ